MLRPYLLICTILFGFLAIVTTNPARAQSVTLVTGDNYYPYTDRRLPGGGLATTIVTTVLQKIGLQPRFVFTSWEDGYEQTKKGRYIATFPYVRTKERAKEFMFSRSLFTARPSLFVNFERAIRIIALDDVVNKSLCVPDGWAVDGYLQPYVSDDRVSVLRAPTMYSCFEKLRSGSVDLVSADSRMGFALADSISASNWTKAFRFSPKGSHNYLMVSRNFPGGALWLEGFNNALSEISAKEIQDVIEQYYAQIR